MKFCAGIVIFLSLGLSVRGQLYSDRLSFFESDTTLNPPRLRTVIGTEAALLGGTLLALNEIWYADYPRSFFHFYNDGNNWQAMDKMGHAVTSYYVGYAGRGMLQWSGVPHKKAVWYGGTLGLVFLTGIEVLDGFSKEWGFSWGDMAANTAGTALLVGQELLWREQRFTLKYSFHQTGFSDIRPDLLGNNWGESAIKDYNGQTYWLSANVHSLSGWEKWPQWLNLAAGYGADGMVTASFQPVFYKENPQYRWQKQYYLALDLDLRKIPVKSKMLKGIFHALNFIKVPLPTLEINEKAAPEFYWLYF